LKEKEMNPSQFILLLSKFEHDSFFPLVKLTINSFILALMRITIGICINKIKKCLWKQGALNHLYVKAQIVH